MSSDMTIEQVCAYVGGDKPVSKATVYRHIKRGVIPGPYKIGPRLVRFSRAELEAAMERLRNRAEAA